MGAGLEDEVVKDQGDHDDVDQGANENDDVGGCDFAQSHGPRTLRERTGKVNVNEGLSGMGGEQS